MYIFTYSKTQFSTDEKFWQKIFNKPFWLFSLIAFEMYNAQEHIWMGINIYF